MAATALTATFVWLLIAVLGAGVYALRVSFIHLDGVVERFPQWLERALTFIPVAILAALVTPALFPLDGPLAGIALNPRALAGTLALATAWRTGSMILTIGVGMGALWTVTFVVG